MLEAESFLPVWASRTLRKTFSLTIHYGVLWMHLPRCLYPIHGDTEISFLSGLFATVGCPNYWIRTSERVREVRGDGNMKLCHSSRYSPDCPPSGLQFGAR